MRCLIRTPEAMAWIDRPLLQYRLHDRNTILEDAITPVRQTMGMLARYAPDLFESHHRPSRQAAFEEHLLRLAGYIERDTRLQALAERKEYEDSLQACIDGLQDHCGKLQAHCDNLQEYCEKLHGQKNRN